MSCAIQANNCHFGKKNDSPCGLKRNSSSMAHLLNNPELMAKAIAAKEAMSNAKKCLALQSKGDRDLHWKQEAALNKNVKMASSGMDGIYASARQIDAKAAIQDVDKEEARVQARLLMVHDNAQTLNTLLYTKHAEKTANQFNHIRATGEVPGLKVATTNGRLLKGL